MNIRKLSIAHVLIVFFVLIITLLGVDMEVNQYQVAKSEQMASLRLSLQVNAEQLRTALRLPEWNSDGREIDRNMESAMEDASLYAIVVKKGDGPPHVLARDKDWRPASGSIDFPKSEDLLVESRHIYYQNKPLGLVTLYATPKYVNEWLAKKWLVTVNAAVLRNLALLALLYALLWRIVLRPLQIIEQYAVAVSSGRADEFFAQSKPRFFGELESLRLSMRKMVALLDQRYEELQEEMRRRSESEACFQQLIHQLPLPLSLSSTEGKTEFLNDRFMSTYGYTLEDVPTVEDWWRLAYPEEDYRQMVKAAYRKHTAEKDLAATPVTMFERRVRCKDGAMRYVEIVGTRIGNTLLNLLHDVTPRRAAEGRLRQLSRALEQSPVSVAIMNTEGVIGYVNPRFTEMTGYSAAEAADRTAWEVLKSDDIEESDHAQILATLKEGGEWRSECRIRKKNRELFWASLSFSVITDDADCITHFLMVKEDITRNKQLTDQILRSQRMESIGTLAGGIAHDLNNILLPIMMGASILQARGPAKSDVEILAAMEEAAKRGADIISQLLTFARGAGGVRDPLKTAKVLEQVARIVRETFPKSIDVEASTAPDAWNVTGNLTQLHQVLLNLCLNARDAMPEGGRLELRGENAEIGSGFVSNLMDALPGRYVAFKVTDTGMGIPLEVREKIFEPFFTTKEFGKGTGLGLSTAVGIIKSHGGFMTLESELGKGTAFTFFIPATTEEPKPTLPTPSLAVPPPPPDIVLVVDDEKAVRTAVRLVLKRHGYDVEEAANGAEGLEIFQQNSQKIRLVITDALMPEMDGVTLAHELKKACSKLPILMMTGQTGEAQRLELKGIGVPTLYKPFNGSELITLIKESLGACD